MKKDQKIKVRNALMFRWSVVISGIIAGILFGYFGKHIPTVGVFLGEPFTGRFGSIFPFNTSLAWNILLGLNAGFYIYLYNDTPKGKLTLRWMFFTFAALFETMTGLFFGFVAGIVITATVASILAIGWIIYKVIKPALRFFADFMLARDMEEKD